MRCAYFRLVSSTKAFPADGCSQIVAFARNPEPKDCTPMFMPMRWRIGPLTMIIGEAPPVVAMIPWMLNSSVHTDTSAAITTGSPRLAQALDTGMAIEAEVYDQTLTHTAGSTRWAKCVLRIVRRDPSSGSTRRGSGRARQYGKSDLQPDVDLAQGPLCDSSSAMGRQWPADRDSARRAGTR
jgi:hypothetical protein